MVRCPLCSSPCTLAKEVHWQLFPGLGIYSGILAMYFQCQSNKSTAMTTTIVFYAICLLYVLSTVNFVCDLVALILLVSNNSVCSKNIHFLSAVQTDSESPNILSVSTLLYSIGNVQTAASGSCDFLAQCILVRINH